MSSGCGLPDNEKPDKKSRPGNRNPDYDSVNTNSKAIILGGYYHPPGAIHCGGPCSNQVGIIFCPWIQVARSICPSEYEVHKSCGYRHGRKLRGVIQDIRIPANTKFHVNEKTVLIRVSIPSAVAAAQSERIRPNVIGGSGGRRGETHYPRCI